MTHNVFILTPPHLPALQLSQFAVLQPMASQITDMTSWESAHYDYQTREGRWSAFNSSHPPINVDVHILPGTIGEGTFRTVRKGEVKFPNGDRKWLVFKKFKPGKFDGDEWENVLLSCQAQKFACEVSHRWRQSLPRTEPQLQYLALNALQVCTYIEFP